MNSSVSDSGDQLIQKLKLNVTKLPKITTPFRTDFSLTWEGSPLKSLPNGNGMVMAIHPPYKPKVAPHKIVRALSRHTATANDNRFQN